MCIITLHKGKQHPDYSGEIIKPHHFKNCHNRNLDGFGMMWHVKGNKFKWLKDIDLDVKRERELYEEALEETTGFIACHWRIGTGGPLNKDNCHPYIHKSIGFMHNGVLRRYSGRKDQSDTKTFFDTIILKQSRGFMNNTTILAMLTEIAKANASKFLLFNSTTAQLFNESAGEKENGVWFSNTNFRYVYVEKSKKTNYGSNYLGSNGQNYADNYNNSYKKNHGKSKFDNSNDTYHRKKSKRDFDKKSYCGKCGSKLLTAQEISSGRCFVHYEYEAKRCCYCGKDLGFPGEKVDEMCITCQTEAYGPKGT